VKGIEVDDTPAMVEGSAEHQRLEEEFLASLKRLSLSRSPITVMTPEMRILLDRGILSSI